MPDKQTNEHGPLPAATSPVGAESYPAPRPGLGISFLRAGGSASHLRYRYTPSHRQIDGDVLRQATGDVGHVGRELVVWFRKATAAHPYAFLGDTKQEHKHLTTWPVDSPRGSWVVPFCLVTAYMPKVQAELPIQQTECCRTCIQTL
jgi:hypothetical protein